MAYIDRYPHWELNLQQSLETAYIPAFCKRLEEEKIEFSIIELVDGFSLVDATVKDASQAFRLGMYYADIRREGSRQLPFPF